MTKTKRDRLTNELLEMADAQRRTGIMDQKTHEEITARHLKQQTLLRDTTLSVDPHTARRHPDR